MTAIARLMSLAFPDSLAEIETLKTIAIFCGVGLLVSLWMVHQGFDLDAALF